MTAIPSPSALSLHFSSRSFVAYLVLLLPFWCPTVHTYPSCFPSSFSRSWNWRNLKTPTFRFRVDGNILKTELFENDGVTIIMWFPIPSLLQTQIQNDRWLHVAFLNSSGTGVEVKHLMRFQSETSVFKSVQGLGHSIKNGFLDTNYSQSDRCKSYIYE